MQNLKIFFVIFTIVFFQKIIWSGRKIIQFDGDMFPSATLSSEGPCILLPHLSLKLPDNPSTAQQSIRLQLCEASNSFGKKAQLGVVDEKPNFCDKGTENRYQGLTNFVQFKSDDYRVFKWGDSNDIVKLVEP